jgi:peptidoglycan/xylan/chitin deacetylase (PgdA/CDA1 family)
MVTFRRLTLFLIFVMAGMNLWGIFMDDRATGIFHAHFVLFNILPPVIWFGISFAMAFLPCTNFHHPVICRGNISGKSIAITFDDGPDPEKTPVILDILKKNQVSATFFCIGKNLAGREPLVKRMHEEGHLIANHSFSHSKWFDLFSSGRMRAELLETDRVIAGITGKTPLFFRPPYGVVNPMVANALKRMHWKAVCWNIRSFDTLGTDPEKTMRRILNQLQPGAILLLHDATRFSGEHLDELITGIRDAGYGVVPLDKMLNLPAYA